MPGVPSSIRGGSCGFLALGLCPRSTSNDTTLQYAAQHLRLTLTFFICRLFWAAPLFAVARFLARYVFIRSQHGTYQFHHDAWSSISGKAKNFIKRLLVRNPQERMSAAEVRFCFCFFMREGTQTRAHF